jgi:filamentous hemagglutinin family protein
VVQGQGTISTPSSTQTVINQSSQQLTLNWSSFNVGANESVRFYQPSSTSVAFNRILGQSASQIFGQIDANGQVVLINPNGLLIGRTAQLNVSSLIVSSLDAIDFNAASGGYRFSATRSAPGSVSNEGFITAQPGGSVTLLGGHVSNSGTIIADYGTVNLAAGRTATLDLAGDGLLRLEIGADLVANPDGAVSAVENSGSIVANGGHVLLTAGAVKNVFENLVNNTGVVRANRIDNSGGTIELLGPGGTVLSSGTLDASAGDRVSTGGSVSVEGDRVGLLGNAVVNVSGATGGGTALIGGDTHGANPDVLDATQAYVSSGTTIDADAGATGDGGRVVVWSNEFTQYYGSLSARGGSLWGNGGSAEVSGKQTLEFDGTANLTAQHGIWGTLLLDPASITIDGSDSATDTTTTQSLTIPNTYPSGANAGDAVTIGSQVIEGLLETGNVSLSATTTITQSNGVIIDSSTNPAALGSGLTLHAGTGITLGTNSQINTNNGAIVLETDAGNITLNSGASLNAGSAAATLIAGGSLVSNVVTLTGAGSIVSNGAGNITTTGLLTLAAGGPIGASGTGNAINTNAGTIVATANAGSIFLAPQNNTTLTDVTAVGAGNSVTVTGTGNLAVVAVSGDGVTLEAPNGAISDAGSGATPVVSSTSAVTLFAGTGIGTAPAVITNLSGGSPLYVQESTGITAAVTSPSGQIDLNVTNLTGPVTLNTGAISLGGTGTTTGSVVLQSDGDIDVFPDAIQVFSALSAQVAVNSTGGTVALQPGSIVTDKAPATLLLSGTDITSGSSSTPHTFTMAAGDLDFIASAPSGDIVLNTAVTRLDANIGGGGGAGNLTVNQTGDLNLGAISAAGTVTVDVTGTLAVDSVSGSSVSLASTQAMTEASGGGNITSNQISLQGTSIGASGAPVDLAATSGAGTSVLNATSSGAVYLSQEVGNLAVNTVSGSSVSLGSNGAITEATGGGNITSNQVALQGQSIGANGAPVNLAATSGAATTVLSTTSSGAVYISQQIGTLGVDSISGGSVNLAFNDALVEAAGGGNITSNQVTLGGILVGGSGTPVDIAATSSGATTAVSATTGNGIYLAQQTGNETLSASSSGGPVSVTTANGGNLAVNTVSGTIVTLAPNGALTEAAGGGSITSNQINLQGTSIGTSAAAVDTAATSGAATTVLNATASGGGVFVAQQTGTLAVQSASGPSVALTSGGALTETAGGIITSDQITLQGASIGTSTTAVNMSAATSADTTLLTATGGVGVYVAEQTGTLAVGSVSGTSVGLTSAGALIEATGGGNITSNQITLRGASIGTSTAPVDTAATSSAATTVLNATAVSGGVYVSQQTGTLAVASASGTNVALTSGGALTESAGGTITSDQITLQGASLGTSTTPLNTFAVSSADTSVLSATAGGGVFVAQQTGTLAVNSVSGTSVALTSAGAITDAAGGGNITSNQITLHGTSIGTSAAAVDTAATSGAATTALNATTTAPGGAIYVAQQIGNVNVTANANGALVNVATSNGGLTAASVTGNGVTLAAGGTGQGLNVSGPVNGGSSDVSLSATGGINLSALVSTTTGVTLSAGGAITAASGGQITANLLTATAASIGTTVSPLNTTVISLDTTSTAGGTFIAQSGDVTVSSAAAGPLDVQTTDGNLTETSAIGNGITLIAGGANKVLTVNSTLNGGADDVTLGASGDGGNIVLNRSVSTTGNATLDAGSSTVGGTITEAPGVSVTSTGLTLLAASVGAAGSPLVTSATSLNVTSTDGGIFVTPTAGLALTANATGGAVDVETVNGPLTVASAAGDGVTLATSGAGNTLTTTGTVDGRAFGVGLTTNGAGSNIMLGGVVTTTGNVSIAAGSNASPGAITAGAGSSVAGDVVSITGASIGTPTTPLTTAANSLSATSLDGGLYVQQAGALTLTANATGGPVDAATTNGALTVVAATGTGVTLTAGGASQNLNLDGAVNGGTGVVSLSAPGGAIVAGAGESITAATLTATAASIGASSAPLATTVGALNATSTNGGIFVSNTSALALTASATGGVVDVGTTDGALTVASATGSGVTLTTNDSNSDITVNGPVSGGSGDVTLTSGAASNINLAGALTTTGNVTLAAGTATNPGVISTAAGNRVTANTLTATGSSIGTGSVALNTAVAALNATSYAGDIRVAQTGALDLTANASGGSLTVTTTNGPLTVESATATGVTLNAGGTSGSITINGSVSGGTGDVSLATPGALVAGAGSLVTADNLSASASQIGTSGARLNTAANTLDVTSTAGGTFVSQTGALVLNGTATGGALDVQAANGALTVASASGSGVTLTTNGAGSNVVLDGVVSSAGAVSVAANEGAILAGASNSVAGGSVTLKGVAIGAGGTPVSTDTPSLSVTSTNGGIFVQQTADMALTASATGGPLDVNTGGALTVASVSGAEVALTAGGAITGGAGSQINATALTASGSTIGSSGSPLITNVSSLNTTSANGGTYVDNAGAVTLTAAATGGALNVQTVNGALTVDAATGAGVTLAAGGAGSGITVSGAVSAGTGDVSLTAGTAASRGAIAEGAGGRVTGGTLSAVAASIGSSAAPLSTAVGSLTANTSTGDIDLAQQGSLKLANVQAAGSLDVSAANGNIVVGNVSAANNAALTANSGAINDDGDDTTRVTATTVTLLARSIGAPSTLTGTTVDSSQRLDTDATNLVATSTAGGVYINQLAGLSSASVHASGGKDGNIELLTATGDINILSMNASGTLLLAAGGNIYALPGAGTITAQAAELRAGGADSTAGHIGTLGRPLILQLASGDTLRMFVPQTVNSSDPNSAPSTLPSAGVESTLVLFAAPSSLAVDAGFGQFTGLSQSQFTSQAELLVHSIQNQTASVESVLGLDWSSFDPNVSLFGKLDPSVCLPGDQRDEEQGADGKGEKCVAP